MVGSLLSRNTERVAKYADMFSAMGTEPRLRIMQLLLSAHPQGLVVGDIQTELDIPNSTLSHHLEKLKTEGLVEVQRQGTFLRYTASTDALQELLHDHVVGTRVAILRPRDGGRTHRRYVGRRLPEQRLARRGHNTPSAVRGAPLRCPSPDGILRCW